MNTMRGLQLHSSTIWAMICGAQIHQFSAARLNAWGNLFDGIVEIQIANVFVVVASLQTNQLLNVLSKMLLKHKHKQISL